MICICEVYKNAILNSDEACVILLVHTTGHTDKRNEYIQSWFGFDTASNPCVSRLPNNQHLNNDDIIRIAYHFCFQYFKQYEKNRLVGVNDCS